MGPIQYLLPIISPAALIPGRRLWVDGLSLTDGDNIHSNPALVMLHPGRQVAFLKRRARNSKFNLLSFYPGSLFQLYNETAFMLPQHLAPDE